MDSQGSSTTDLGISATLAAIDTVRVGEPFHCDIFLLNQSAAATRKLSVVVESQSSNSTSVQHQSSGELHDTDPTVPVYVEESALLNLTKNMQLSPTGLVCLTTDLNVE